LQDLWLLDIPLFSGLDRIHLAKLIPELERTSFSAGEIVFRQGDPGTCLYIIIDGDVDVFLEDGGTGRRSIATLGRRECFGEMALLTGQPRSTGVRALTELTVYTLPKEGFDKLLVEHPVLAVHFSLVLSTRLAAVDAEIQHRRERTGEDEQQGRGGADKISLPRAPVAFSARTKPPLLEISELFSRKSVSRLAAVSVLIILSSLLLGEGGLLKSHIILLELLLAATAFWVLNIVSYHVVAVALPVLAVLFGVATPENAFHGFASPTWFLVLGVFAIVASISKTGLLFRLALHSIKMFPQNYFGQVFAFALSGLVLTPIIPSSIGRAVLASPLVLNFCEALRFRKDSPASIGMAMSCLLGFGHMSFMFMNGTATCFFVFGLLPPEVREGITWGYWLKVAFPLGLFFFLLSYVAIVLTSRPKEKITINPNIVNAQIKTLGPMTAHEKISLLAVVVCLLGFLTEPWHRLGEAWIAMLCFLILYGSSVLTESAVRSEIDWNFLISFGALISFGSVMSSSGLTDIIAGTVAPFLAPFSGSKILFLLAISAAVHLLRLALPIPPAQLISMLAIMPLISKFGIHPFVIGLVVLVSSNSWILPHQNMLFLNVLHGTEERLFSHGRTLKLAVVNVAVILIAIALSEPYWKYLGLVR
jgi:branched-chain amino acid transport system substrate-binding protein